MIELYKTLDHSILQTQLQCGILSNDYTINYDKVPLLVEINTIAPGVGYLSKKVSDFHSDLLQRNENVMELQSIIHEFSNNSYIENKRSHYQANNILENPSGIVLARC